VEVLPEVQLSSDDARSLTDRIKIAVEGTWLLIEQAYTSRAWSALGYASWDDYCTREFGGARLRLPREERQEVVASLRDSGLSARAIASATGLARNTVRRELREQVGQLDPPAPTPILGADGKSYSPRVPDRQDAVPVPPAPEKKRRPLTEAFRDVGYDLIKVAERIDRLTTDDRFHRNAEQVALTARGDLLRALDLLTTAVGRIPSTNEKG
jgi:transposase-like protein